MLVLVSFVLVLAAAVTLVVGLLQSGLTLIYLSIGCSVLAGVVLAVAVLRGRPEPKAAPAGRAYSPPPQPAQVPTSVGAPSSSAESTGTWRASPAPAPPPPPPTPYTPQPAGSGDDVATKAAGAALLGRLRGRRGDKAGDAEPEPLEPAPAVGAAPVDATTEMPAAAAPVEDEGGFPIADYDRLRATELLSQLPALDRNQLEAVREREASGKNRFTIMSRVDALLATAQEPAWEVDGDEWEAGDGVEGEPEVLVAEAGGFDDDFDDDEDRAPMAAGASFPIPSYETLTVGQILPRLTELDADELAQVRTREQMGRSRGTILDRIDRLVSRRAPTGTAVPGGAAIPAAPVPAPPAPAPARRTPARKAPAVSKTTAPAVKKAARAPAAPAPAPAARKAAVKKTPPAAAVVPAPRKARAPKAAPPVVPAAPSPTPMKEAVKKARAAKAKKV